MQKEEVRQELLKIIKTIKDLHELNCEPPRELLEKRKTLEDKLRNIINNEDIQILSDLRERLNELVRELDHILRKPRASVKASPKRLRVQFDDGKVFDFPKAVDTFIETLRFMGLDKCAKIKTVIQLGYPVVAPKPNEYKDKKPGFIKEIDGYFLETKTSTDRKADQLREYARELDINIQVESIE